MHEGETNFRTGQFDENISHIAFQNCPEQHRVRLSGALAAWHSAQVSPFGLDKSHLPFANGGLFGFGIDFIFRLLELAEPAVHIGLGASPAALAKIIKDDLCRLVLLLAMNFQLRFAHR